MATKQTIRKREYQRQHHAENREEYNQRSSQWYYEHREEVLRKYKERMATDPDYAEKIRQKDRRNYRLRQAAKKSMKNNSKKVAPDLTNQTTASMGGETISCDEYQ